MNPIIPMDQWILLLAVTLAAGGFLAWRSAAKASIVRRSVVTGLRVAGLALLGLIALNPGHWREQAEERPGAWAVLLDRSLSMATPDINGRNRWTEACRLTAKAVAAATVPDRVRIHTFSGRLESALDRTRLDAPDLQPTGDATDIPGVLLAMLNAFRAGSLPLAGLILLSDGRQVAPTDMTPAILMACAQQTPVYTLCVGSIQAPRDLAVSVERRQIVTFVGQKFKITARVAQERLGPIRPTVQLIDPSGTVADERIVDLPENGGAAVQFEVASKERGYFRYRVRAPQWEGEITTGNNEAAVDVAVLENKIRIFMAEGTPFWDSKFVAQWLRRQPNLELTSIYRFSSNRFFKVETDAGRVSDASTPVFPDDDEALAQIDLMIFGRGIEYFLTPERVARLKHYVGEQGGCIVFARGKPYSGTFPELEPLEPAVWGESFEYPLRFQPTTEGELAGLFGEVLPGRGQPIWDQLPPLRRAQRCTRLKTFTRVLAEGVHTALDGATATPVPLLLSRRYGKGIVVSVNAEDLWQWFFFPSIAAAAGVYQDFWVQLLTWAGTYSDFLPGRQYALSLSDTAVLPDVPVRARIMRRSAGAGPTPTLRITRDKQTVLELATAPASDEGRWDALFSLEEPGVYRVELAGLDEAAAGGVSAMLLIKAPPAEKDTLSADPDFLARLAQATGGRMITEGELESVVSSFEPEGRTVDLNKAEWTPVWDRAWLLAFILLIFSAEWFIRRRGGLL